MAEQLTVTAGDLQKNGIAPGSNAERAILVDIVFAAKAYKNLPEDAKKKMSPDDVKKLINDTVDGKNGENPFGKDPNTNQVIKNYANALVDRSVAIDKANGQAAGTNVKAFLVRTSEILNDHKTLDGRDMLLNDKNIEKTVKKAGNGASGVAAAMMGDPKAGLTLEEAKGLAVELDDVRKQLENPEHKHLGVKNYDISEDGKKRNAPSVLRDFNDYVTGKNTSTEKAPAADAIEPMQGVKKGAKFSNGAVKKPDDDDLTGSVLGAMEGGSGLGAILKLILMLFNLLVGNKGQEQGKAPEPVEGQDQGRTGGGNPLAQFASVLTGGQQQGVAGADPVAANTIPGAAGGLARA